MSCGGERGEPLLWYWREKCHIPSHASAAAWPSFYASAVIKHICGGAQRANRHVIASVVWAGELLAGALERVGRKRHVSDEIVVLLWWQRWAG